MKKNKKGKNRGICILSPASNNKQTLSVHQSNIYNAWAKFMPCVILLLLLELHQRWVWPFAFFLALYNISISEDVEGKKAFHLQNFP